MLYDFFSVNDLLPSSKIKETFNELYIKVNLTHSKERYVTKLFDELKTLSVRDSFEMFLDISGDDIKISNTSSDSLRLITDLLANNKEENEYEIVLDIKKVINEHTVSIYFIEIFAKYLNNSPLKDIFVTLSTIHNGKLLFEVFSTIVPFYSSGMHFYQSGQPIEQPNFLSQKKRLAILEMFSENSNLTDVNLQVLPSDFNLVTDPESQEIDSFFKKACGTLSIIFMANTSGFKSKEELAYKISGFKTIACESVGLFDIRSNSELLYKLMSWSFEGGSCADKISLLRNILSIHLDDCGNIKFDNEVWDTVRSNYQIYLKGNIQDYLNVKNKIGEIIIESTNKTHAIADDLLNVFKNNVFVILTFILSVVVVNGFKSNGTENIFSAVYLAIVIILSLVSSIWLAMTAYEARNRFNAASETIKEILNLNYSKIIMDSEIDDSVDPVIESNRAYLNDQITRYSKWWIAIASTFIISFCIAFFIFKSTKPTSIESSGRKGEETSLYQSSEQPTKIKQPPKVEQLNV